MGKPPSDADQLYGLPLREFTRARAALVTRLHEAGQLDEAAHVKTLPRPSLPVWAINQVARADRIGVERLVRAVEAVKRGQLGEGGPVATAVEVQQAALRALRERAADVLKADGMKATAETLERVSRTLLGAAVSAPDDLRHGRLTAEVPLPGFDALAGATPRVRRLEPHRPPVEPRAVERLRERVERAREALRTAGARAAEAKQRAAELEEQAAEARRAADEAARAAQRGREDAESAAVRAREAAQAVDEAARALEKAQRAK